jgi:hypothetical protein
VVLELKEVANKKAEESNQVIDRFTRRWAVKK